MNKSNLQLGLLYQRLRNNFIKYFYFTMYLPHHVFENCVQKKFFQLFSSNIKSRFWSHIPNIFSIFQNTSPLTPSIFENMLGMCVQNRLLMLLVFFPKNVKKIYKLYSSKKYLHIPTIYKCDLTLFIYDTY